MSTFSTGAGRLTRKYTPILLIHGITLSEDHDCRNFDNLHKRLRTKTWRPAYQATIAEPAYYYGDGGKCDHAISHHGRHDRHFGDYDALPVTHTKTASNGPHRGGQGHTLNTNIRHLAYHLAWYIHDHYTARKEPLGVSIVAHSMGAVVTRYALAMVDHEPRFRHGFRTAVRVNDVVLASGPHRGAPVAQLCPGISAVIMPIQCSQLDPGKADDKSSFLWDLNAYGQNPQQATGTDWTLLGSKDDQVVPDWSASYMRAHKKFTYADGEDLRHSDMVKNFSSCPCKGFQSWHNATPWTSVSLRQPSRLIDAQLWEK